MKTTNTIKMVTTAMLCAISIVLVYLVHFPIIPSASFLEYDPADISIFIGTFLFGPLTGLIMTVVVSIIQALTVSAASGWLGALMHILATGSFVLVAGFIYKHKRTKTRAIIALACGIITMTFVMVICNLVFDPLFWGYPLDTVVALLLPAIIPFNLIKATANSIITFLLYNTISKPISKLITKSK